MKPSRIPSDLTDPTGHIWTKDKKRPITWRCERCGVLQTERSCPPAWRGIYLKEPWGESGIQYSCDEVIVAVILAS